MSRLDAIKKASAKRALERQGEPFSITAKVGWQGDKSIKTKTGGVFAQVSLRLDIDEKEMITLTDKMLESDLLKSKEKLVISKFDYQQSGAKEGLYTFFVSGQTNGDNAVRGLKKVEKGEVVDVTFVAKLGKNKNTGDDALYMNVTKVAIVSDEAAVGISADEASEDALL